MAKRRTRAKSKLTWKKLLAYFIPVVVVVFLVLNYNGGNILGTSDSSEKGGGLFNFGSKFKKTAEISPKPAPKPSCNKVTSFSALTICESTENSGEKAGNNMFTSYSYTCQDGTTGTVDQKEGKCVPIGKAFELARKACHQKCKPTKTPTPTEEIQPQ